MVSHKNGVGERVAFRCRKTGGSRILSRFVQWLLQMKRGGDFDSVGCATWGGRVPGSSGLVGYGAAAVILLCMISTGVGCATGRSRNAREKLGLALLHFNSGVRWGRHQEAADFFPVKLRDRYLKNVEKLDEKVRVSEVEPLRIDFSKNGRLAKVRYRFTWHSEDEMLVRKSVIIEYWYWNRGKWRLVKLSRGPGEGLPYFEGVFTKKLSLADIEAKKSEAKNTSKSGSSDDSSSDRASASGSGPAAPKQ